MIVYIKPRENEATRRKQRSIKNKSLLRFDACPELVEGYRDEPCPIADAVNQMGNLMFQAKERLPRS
jgi:hypothetical protein